jgi:hypothetical protein
MNDEQLMKELEDNLPAKSCFWRHKWTKWGMDRKERYTSMYIVGTFLQTVQTRRCLRCGVAQERVVT